MTELRPETRAYVAILTATTAVGATALLWLDQFHTGFDPTAALFGMLAMMVAWLCPIPFGFQTKFYLDTCVVFAAALIFEPGQAMVIVAIGTFAAQVIRRRTAPEVTFNTSQTALQAAIAGLILHAGGWTFDQTDFASGSVIGAIALAALSTYVVNSLLVGGMIAFESSASLLSALAPSNFVSSFGEIASQLGQITMGLLAVKMIAVNGWWLTGLFPALFALFILTSRHLKRGPSEIGSSIRAFGERTELWWHGSKMWFWYLPCRFTTRGHCARRLRSTTQDWDLPPS